MLFTILWQTHIGLLGTATAVMKGYLGIEKRAAPENTKTVHLKTATFRFHAVHEGFSSPIILAETTLVSVLAVLELLLKRKLGDKWSHQSACKPNDSVVIRTKSGTFAVACGISYDTHQFLNGNIKLTANVIPILTAPIVLGRDFFTRLRNDA